MRNQKVAIFGSRASFHDLAAQKYFGNETDVIECTTFKDVCMRVFEKEVETAVMAIENSTVGSILSNYNLIEKFDLFVTGELYVKIELHLLALPGVRIEDVEYIHSHPMAISQCQDYLCEHKEMMPVELNDTATCTKNIAKNGWRNIASIANDVAAARYGLEIIEWNIESNKRNYTRFLILTGEKKQDVNSDKASLSLYLKHEPNSLARALNVIGIENVNLSKIQSVPIIGNINEYSFHLDLEWQSYMDYQRALATLKRMCNNVKVLGEYKKSYRNSW